MMFDQVDVVRSKVTHIDRFKGADVGGKLAGVIEVFGVGRRGVDSSFEPTGYLLLCVSAFHRR